MVQAFRESDWRGGHYYVGGILTIVEVLPLDGGTLLRGGGHTIFEVLSLGGTLF